MWLHFACARFFSFCAYDPTGETHFIAEDLDLAGGSVYELVGSRADVVGVDLQVQRKTFHSLLRGEVRAQGVDADVHLEERERVGHVLCDREDV